MSWNRWYALRSYRRSALWIVPFFAFLAVFVLIRVLAAVDQELGWSWTWKVEPSGAQAVLQTFIGVLLSLVVFTFGSLLVAIQVASAQLTPRIIATTLLRDNRIRWLVGLFIFSLFFCTGVLARAQTTVPYLLLTIAAFLGSMSLVAFLYLIDYAARLLRPVSIVQILGDSGVAVIESVYPRLIGKAFVPPPLRAPLPAAERVIEHRGRAAIILAVNMDALVREARLAGGLIEFVHSVGDFLADGEPLFRLYGGAGRIEDGKLRALVALGPERTIEQDATFALRIIVDIASKALSKAINDPTTAVLAIDQIHRLLRLAGQRVLQDDAVRDSDGEVRLILPTPNWEDFVQLACREIRLYGAENFQIARRLLAMLENLLRVLPEPRWPALREEVELLDLMIDKVYLLPRDAAVARIPDLQGIGSGRARA